ncbi:LysR family transcriptional regulator [Pseudonocardia zijingensis]|uniref:LysR family transcriptional regulator n=1 Tax=Pseudonocardia zijingensis TaxID=153376 RepID=A0ABP3YKD6_9PSEU
MELRHLRYLVEVVRHEHFGRAARALGITQPPLSQQIQALEAEVGAPLLERTRHGVEPTAAGEAFLEHARAALAEADAALAAARRVARGEAGTVSVAFTPSAVDHVLPQFLTPLRRRWPDIVVRPAEYTLTLDAVAALVRGDADAVIGRLPVASAAGQASLLALPLQEDRVDVVLPRNHPLAGRDRVPVARLRDESFVLTPLEERHPRYWHVACRAAGFEPRIAGLVHGVHTLAGVVAAGLGVGLAPQSTQRRGTPGAVFVPVSPAVLAPPLTLVWRADDRSESLARVVGTIRTVLGVEAEPQDAVAVDRAYVAAVHGRGGAP